jgi:hypothetical protein
MWACLCFFSPQLVLVLLMRLQWVGWGVFVSDIPFPRERK